MPRVVSGSMRCSMTAKNIYRETYYDTCIMYHKPIQRYSYFLKHSHLGSSSRHAGGSRDGLPYIGRHHVYVIHLLFYDFLFNAVYILYMVKVCSLNDRTVLASISHRSSSVEPVSHEILSSRITKKLCGPCRLLSGDAYLAKDRVSCNCL